MKIDYKGTEYEIIQGSDILRNGVFLELTEYCSNFIDQVAEVFIPDDEGEVIFSCRKQSVPYEVISVLISEANREFDINGEL